MTGQRVAIVPAHNAAATVGACLGALRESFDASAIVLVDDGSTDRTGAIAHALGVRVLRLEGPRGPAAARNAGIAACDADVVLFVDADVFAGPAAVRCLLDALDADPALAGVFGSYDASPPARNAASLFKNLLHHFVHQQADERSTSFWAGFGALRRTAALATGGFDEARYPRPSIEDIELGARLWRAERPVRLVKAAQVTHAKAWTLSQLVRTDVRDRAWPWSELILSRRLPAADLNLRTRDRVSAVVVWLLLGTIVAAVASLVAAGLGMLTPGAARAWAAASALTGLAALATLLVLNRRLYRFFAACGGGAFALSAVGLHALYYLYGSATYGLCIVRHTLTGPRDRMETRT